MPTPQVGKRPFDDLVTNVPDHLRRAMAETTCSKVSPASPSQVVKDINPSLAREFHKRMVADETGEAAEALYGTTREEAMAKDILPEPEFEAGKMPNKVEMGSAKTRALSTRKTPQFVKPVWLMVTLLSVI